jgi:hypothetical protein
MPVAWEPRGAVVVLSVSGLVTNQEIAIAIHEAVANVPGKAAWGSCLARHVDFVRADAGEVLPGYDLGGHPNPVLRCPPRATKPSNSS